LEAVAARIDLSGLRERDPDVNVHSQKAAEEAAGRDSLDGERLPVQEDRPPEDRRVARERALPEGVREDGDGTRAFAGGLRGKEGPPRLRTHAEDVEIVARYERAGEKACRLARGRAERDARPTLREDAVEDIPPGGEVPVLGMRERDRVARRASSEEN